MNTTVMSVNIIINFINNCFGFQTSMKFLQGRKEEVNSFSLKIVHFERR